MKGFKDKSGKFRPTGNRTKSSLKKSDINNDPLERARKNMSKLPEADPVKLKKGMIRKDEELDDERKIQEKPYSQVAIWGSTVVGKDKSKEFEDFMKSEYGVRVKYLEEIKTFPDRDQNDSNIEGTGGRNDVFFSVHEDDIPKFAVKRFGMDPPVRWIEDVIANQSEPLTIYPESVKGYRTWEA